MPTHRLVLNRLRRELPTMTAVVALIVITTTLLAVLARFVSAAGDTAARQALDSWRQAGQLTARLDTHPDPAKRGAALAALTQDAAGLPHATITTAQVSVSYALPDAEKTQKTPTSDPPLMTFWAADQLDAKAKLVAGSWPTGGGAAGPVQTAVPRAAADELKLTVGTQLTVTNRITNTPLQITVVGIYQPADVSDRYWRLDPLGGTGVSRPEQASSGFLQYGPFAMDPAAFDRAAGPVGMSTLRAQITPDTSRVGVSGIQRFADQLTGLVGTLKGDTRLGTAIQADVSAPTQVAALRHSLAVTASSALIPTVLLAVLALCALTMSASLLVEYRALTTALMRARGAGAPTLAGQALLEALLFTVPTAVAAPFIAGFLVPHLFSGTSAPGSAAPTWIASIATAALCTVTLVAAAMRGTTGRGTYADAQRARSRRARGVVLRRIVLEIGFVALGLLGYSQLHRYGAAGSQGSDTGVNLVLVTAPAFALAAAALICVRIVPLFGWLGQIAAHRGRRFSFELGAWRAGRGGRIGTPALLLVVGVAMAVLSTSYSASWRRAQADQGGFSVGSDLRASGYARPGVTVAGVGDRLPAGAAGMLVSRDVDTVGSTNTSATVLAVQSDKLAGALNLRPDLYPGGAAKLAADLAAQPRAATLPLPGKPTGLALRVKTGFCRPVPLYPNSILGGPPTVTLTVSFAGRVGPGAQSSVVLPLDDQVHDLTLPFDLAGTGAGQVGEPAWPLGLQGMTVDIETTLAPQVLATPNGESPPAPFADLQFTMDVLSARPIAADGSLGAPLAPPAAGSWRSRSSTQQNDFPSSVDSNGAFLNTATRIEATGEPQTLAVGPDQTPGLMTPAQAGALPPVPAVVSAGYLKATGQHVGDTTKIRVATQAIPARIVGVIGAMPGLEDDKPAVMVDLERWNTRSQLAAGRPLADTTLEWWVRTPPGGGAATAATLTATDRPAAVAVAADTVKTLTTDPAQNGVRSAYLLAAAAAAAFALIDFLVHLVGAVRERTTQNALVRALGATSRQVGVATSVELAFLIGVGVVAGCAIGELLAHLLIPSVMVTRDGSPAVPPVLITDPWVRIAELAGAAAVALGLGVTAVLLSGRRTAVGSMLRLGED